MEKGLGYLKETFELEYQDIRTYSPLTLAYIGDAIYELVIRTILVEKGNTQVNKLHKRASRLVKASAQSAMIEKLKPYLTEEEMGVFKRGRNAKAATMAKNATMSDYRRATGFEALMGYLYLTEQWERMLELMKTGIREVEQDGENNPGK
nr:ribonuclease III domain-containing protein [uncultured Blautia sp.]